MELSQHDKGVCYFHPRQSNLTPCLVTMLLSLLKIISMHPRLAKVSKNPELSGFPLNKAPRLGMFSKHKLETLDYSQGFELNHATGALTCFFYPFDNGLSFFPSFLRNGHIHSITRCLDNWACPGARSLWWVSFFLQAFCISRNPKVLATHQDAKQHCHMKNQLIAHQQCKYLNH